jgi:hypothetical protein
VEKVMPSRRSLAWLLWLPWMLAMAVAPEALAQDESRPSESSGTRMGVGYFMAGLRLLDTDPISDRLVAAGYPEVGSRFLSLGGGGYGLVGRWILGGEGHALSSTGAEPRGGLRAELSGGYGLFRAGYVLFQSQSLSVYPMVGFGGGGMGLTLTSRRDSTFDDLLANPSGQVTLSKGGLLLDAGVGAEFRIRLGGTEREHGFVLLGVRAGYQFFLSVVDDWETAGGGKVTGAPDFGLSGPGVQLLVGFGGMKSAL